MHLKLLTLPDAAVVNVHWSCDIGALFGDVNGQPHWTARGLVKCEFLVSVTSEHLKFPNTDSNMARECTIVDATFIGGGGE